MPGLGTSFGRGGATTAQQDLANADCILIEGSSMAEAHPVGFRWVMKAKERGATIIHVDPRFSRTSALADIWVPIRAGGDIAFLGGLVRHIIENDLFFRDYVVHFTNASCILREDFRDTEEGETGFFSGWSEGQRAYNKESWAYYGDGGLSFPERDLDLATSALRFPNVAPPFCALHAGNGGKDLRDFTRTLSQSCGCAR